MATKEEVERFLMAFHEKVEVFDIIFRNDRNKNNEALAELEITPIYRKEVIKTLTVNDYSDGPIIDTLNRYGEMWVFGKAVKGNEVYIKISYGLPNSNTICISFHRAEYPMQYPYREE